MRITAALLAALVVAAPAAAAPLEQFNHRLFLPVTVNGHPTVALLDSAAEMTVLDDDFATGQLGLRLDGSATAHGSGAEVMEARFADHVSVAVLGTRLDLRAVVIDLDEVSQRLLGRPVRMLLGRELFDRERLRIDIAGGTIDRTSGAARGTRLAVADYRGNPVITATIEGHETSQAVFDLGNGSGILIGRAFARRNGLDAPDRIVGQADGGGLGGTIRRDRIVLRDLTVGSRTFHNVPAEIDDTETAADVNLGTAVLGNFIITTDFAQHALWLEPRE